MFAHLRSFIEEQLGTEGWRRLLEDAELGPRVYLPIRSYPDQEMVAIVTAASRATGLPAPRLLEAFGRHVAPHLLGMYRHLLDPAWRTLDVLEHVEETAHRVVRIEKPGATPPYLVAHRISENRIEITYTSARRLCHVAKGIVHGLAQHFAQRITIRETACMHNGDDRCQLVILDNTRFAPAG